MKLKKCEEDLEANIHRLRKARIILNVPEDINTNNIEDTIIRQNPDLHMTQRNMIGKFTYVTKKKYRNAVLEVGPEVRKTLLHRKIELG
jgi:hypothetical protein